MVKTDVQAESAKAWRQEGPGVSRDQERGCGTGAVWEQHEIQEKWTQG